MLTSFLHYTRPVSILLIFSFLHLMLAESVGQALPNYALAKKETERAGRGLGNYVAEGRLESATWQTGLGDSQLATENGSTNLPNARKTAENFSNAAGTAKPAFEIPCGATVTTLLAGKTIDVGTVTAWHSGQTLYVRYETKDGWVMDETHLAAAYSLKGIPQNKNGCPEPGKFSYKKEHEPAVTEYTYSITSFDVTKELYLAAHAEVKKPSEKSETAWANGKQFSCKNWATYFIREAPDIEPPQVTATADPTESVVGQLIMITVTASDNVAVVSKELQVNGIEVPLQGDGTAEYIPGAPGTYAVVATAEDAYCNVGTAETNFVIRPTDNQPPRVFVAPSPTRAQLGQTVKLFVSAEDDEGVASSSLLVNGTPISLDANGMAFFTPFTLGVYTAIATATDISGQTASDETNFDVIPKDDLPPVVTVAAAPETVAVGDTVCLSLTATDDQNLTYKGFEINGVRLKADDHNQAIYAPKERGSYQVIGKAYDLAGNLGTDTTTVVAAVLDKTPPSIWITARPVRVVVGETVELSVLIVENIGLVDTSLTVQGTVLDLDAAGKTHYVPTVAGIYRVHATATDLSGNIGHADTSFVAVNPGTSLDLAALEVNADETRTDSTSLLISGTVKAKFANRGKDNLLQSFKIIFWEDVGCDGIYQAGLDNVLGTTVFDSTLAAGDTTIVAAQVFGSVLFPGNVIRVFLDSENKIIETNEVNNIAASNKYCISARPVGQFHPVLEWEWTGSPNEALSNQVMMLPAIIDLTQDGIPDIVFSTFTGKEWQANGILRAISGNDGTEIFSVTDRNYHVNPSGNIAVGDIDLDGQPEILVSDETGDHLLAFEHNGAFKWRSPTLTRCGNNAIGYGGASIADIDQNGIPEIVIARYVLNNDGTIRWSGAYGCGENQWGPVSIIANLDLSGTMEILAGNTAYRSDGSIFWQNTTLQDGYNAAANFDDDPFPEVVLVTGHTIYLLEHTGAIKWGPIEHPGGGIAGPPTIADVDQDGKPEICVAAASAFAVFETDGNLKWNSPPAFEHEYGVTGSSVFDFEGDGTAEVVYADEDTLSIYRGTDGAILWKTFSPSGTAMEIPIIADVDADGNAEIIKISNNLFIETGSHGIQVFGDSLNSWVSTRSIWNQHTNHVTNVNDDGTIPKYEEPSWLVHNTYRCNLQPGFHPQAAPDLVASGLKYDFAYQQLSVRIGNAGAVIAGDNIPISFYDGHPDSGGTLIGTTYTTKSLPVGCYEDVSVYWANPTLGSHDVYVAADNVGLQLPTAPEISVPAGFEVETFAPVTRPTSLAFAPEGSVFGPDLYVGSALWSNNEPGGDPGQLLADSIFTISKSAKKQLFATLVGEADPDGLEFPPLRSPFGDFLYVSANNRDFYQPGSCGGVIQRVDINRNVFDFTSLNGCNGGLSEPCGIAFGPGGGFGIDLFVANSSGAPGDIVRVFPDGRIATFFDRRKSWIWSRSMGCEVWSGRGIRLFIVFY
jgi:FG-GAP-like repeat